MKTLPEDIQYKNLQIRMQSKADSLNVNWAKHYAFLLGFGGTRPEIQIYNIFNDSNKKFNSEHMAIIYNDLEDISNIKPLTQSEIKYEIFSSVTSIGELTKVIQNDFDNDENINKKELSKLLPNTRALFFKVRDLHFRALETKYILN